MTTVGELGERALVRLIADTFARTDPRVLLGIGDDAAVLRASGDVVASVDSVEAGVDWLIGRTPRDAIGHRAAAVSLSDLAAMGARPLGLLLALELPASTLVADVGVSLGGLKAVADEHDVSVVGGDVGYGSTERWTVTALGEVTGEPLRRDAARPGDRLWLVGDVGRAAIGLAAVRAGRPHGLQACVQAHLKPRPLVAQGARIQALRASCAAIDISDGLLLDAERLAAASGVQLAIDLPRPAWLTHEVQCGCDELGVDWRVACGTGGDDYALLVSARADVAVPDAICIGRVLSGVGVTCRIDGVAVAPGGFLHGQRRA